MISTDSKTVLMVYAISPEIQARKKAVFGSRNYKESLLLFEKLHDNTTAEAARSGLRTVWMYDEKQLGTTFGERYSNAFASLFEKGYEHIISIGNDIPHLSSRHILEAEQQLQNSVAVLGPAEDGGDYLIAISRSHFDKESIKNLPWNSSNLHHSLKTLISGKGVSVCQLEYLIDIDDFKSLSGFKKAIKSGDFFHFLNFLFQSLIRTESKKRDFFEIIFLEGDHPLRAPPARRLAYLTAV